MLPNHSCPIAPPTRSRATSKRTERDRLSKDDTNQVHSENYSDDGTSTIWLQSKREDIDAHKTIERQTCQGEVDQINRPDRLETGAGPELQPIQSPHLENQYRGNCSRDIPLAILIMTSVVPHSPGNDRTRPGDSTGVGPDPNRNGIHMLKKALFVAVFAGVTLALAAPTASADSPSLPGPTDQTQHYVSVFDPAAYGPRSTDSLLLSPFGTSQPISCWSFHGWSGCWQTDPWGRNHDLYNLQIPTGSSSGDSRMISVFNPF